MERTRRGHTSVSPRPRRSRAGRPASDSIRSRRDVDAAHSARSIGGAASRSAASTTGGTRPLRAHHVVEDLDLLRQAGVREQVEFALTWRRATPASARIADQERVCHRTQPVAVDVRQQVMRHLLLVEDAHSLGQPRQQRVDHAPPVTLVSRDDLVGARMSEAACGRGSARRTARRPRACPRDCPTSASTRSIGCAAPTTSQGAARHAWFAASSSRPARWRTILRAS